MGGTLADDMERAKKERTVIADEKGYMKPKGEFTRWEQLRIFLNQWWVFIAIIIAASQVIQAVVSILNYLRCG